MDSTRRRNAPARYPCIVASDFVRSEIDPRIKTEWPTVKFGDLRKTWRRRHCATLNPYGSDGCPFSPEDCALAYLVCATQSSTRSSTNPMGYFWKAAHSMALDRADNKPLARDAEKATERSGNTRGAREGHADRHGRLDGAQGDLRPGTDRGGDEGGLHRERTGPSRIGTLLGTLDFGPREGLPNDGEEGSE